MGIIYRIQIDDPQICIYTYMGIPKRPFYQIHTPVHSTRNIDNLKLTYPQTEYTRLYIVGLLFSFNCLRLDARALSCHWVALSVIKTIAFQTEISLRRAHLKCYINEQRVFRSHIQQSFSLNCISQVYNHCAHIHFCFSSLHHTHTRRNRISVNERSAKCI